MHTCMRAVLVACYHANACPTLPTPWRQVGLRVMHRTTVQGQYVPRKQNDPRFQKHALQADEQQQQEQEQQEQPQRQEQQQHATGQKCC